jgi:HD-like signal output (HDOD) protein
MELIKTNDASAKSLAEVIQNDNTLTTKVLRVVNSAYYAIPSKVSTIAQAVVILGLDTIKNLVLSMSIMELLVSDSDQVQQIQNLWESSWVLPLVRLHLCVKIRSTPMKRLSVDCWLM